jgi:hypothetical protein
MEEVMMAGQETSPNAPPAPVEFEMPEKFQGKSAEDIAKAYVELESLHGKKQELVEPPQEPQENTDKPPETPPAEDRFVVGGYDFTDYAQEFNDRGQLSEESYEKIAEEYGFSKEIVDTYIAGQQARSQNSDASLEKDVLDHAGGQEEFNKVAAWAKQNSPDLVSAYQATLATRNATAIKLAYDAIKESYTKDVGGDPKLTFGKGRPGTVKAFRSTEEVVAAMRDPRYKNDPAYRADVAARIAAADV